MTTSGNMTFSSGDVEVNIEPVYAAVFECEHKVKFITQGPDSAHQALYNKLHEGDSVNIEYTEIWRYTLKDIDGDKKKEVILRELMKYDFLDANAFYSPSKN